MHSFCSIDLLRSTLLYCFLFLSQRFPLSWGVGGNLFFFFFYGCIGVDARGCSGSLFLFWNDPIKVCLRSYSPGNIDCMVLHDSLTWCFTGLYGNPCAQTRKHFWNLLRKINSLSIIGHYAWLLGGDFNEIFMLMRRRGPILFISNE